MTGNEKAEALARLRVVVFASKDGEPMQQKEIADLLRVDLGTWNRWENKRQEPPDSSMALVLGRVDALAWVKRIPETKHKAARELLAPYVLQS